MCSLWKNIGKILENRPFSGRIRPDWGNTARADMAELGSIGLTWNDPVTVTVSCRRKSFSYHHRYDVIIFLSLVPPYE